MSEAQEKKRSDEMKLLEVKGRFSVSSIYNDSSFDEEFKKAYGSVFFDICVEKKTSHCEDTDCFYVYGKPAFFNTILSDVRVCLYASRSFERVNEFIQNLIPYEESDDSAAEETANEVEVQKDLEVVQGGVSEFRGSVSLPGNVGDDLPAGDSISVDSRSSVSVADEPVDDLGPDPDVAVKDCTDYSAFDLLNVTVSVLSTLIGGVKYD